MWETWGEGEKRTCGVPAVPPAEVLDAHLSSASIFTIASGGKLGTSPARPPARSPARPPPAVLPSARLPPSCVPPACRLPAEKGGREIYVLRCSCLEGALLVPALCLK